MFKIIADNYNLNRTPRNANLAVQNSDKLFNMIRDKTFEITLVNGIFTETWNISRYKVEIKLKQLLQTNETKNVQLKLALLNNIVISLWGKTPSVQNLIQQKIRLIQKALLYHTQLLPQVWQAFSKLGITVSRWRCSVDFNPLRLQRIIRKWKLF